MSRNGTKGMAFFLPANLNVSKTIENMAEASKLTARSMAFLENPRHNPVIHTIKPSPVPIWPFVIKLTHNRISPKLIPPRLNKKLNSPFLVILIKSSKNPVNPANIK